MRYDKDTWVKFYTKSAVFSCFAGLLLSIYAYYVAVQLEQDRRYQPLCDVSPLLSCSIVFESEYSHGFGFMGDFLGKNSLMNVKNSLVGIIFYSIMILLSQSTNELVLTIGIWLNILACASSIYFAYLLVFVIKQLCIVCVATYFVNTTVLVSIFAKKRRVIAIKEDMERQKESQKKDK